MSTPIERIAGYACEVNVDHWRELVKVADEVGIKCPFPEWDSEFTFAFVDGEDELDCHETKKAVKDSGLALIPYPDFLEKLKGDEKWEPKNGDEVEVRREDNKWHLAKFVGMHEGFYVCRCRNEFIGFQDVLIRPLRPTITRTEAEQTLGKRIVD